MNIGIFSGSFNPIHIGHIILANYIVEFTDIDEVWMLVSPQNPLKDDKGLADENDRYQMVETALRAYPKLKASKFEFSMPKPSYTIDTLKALKQTYPQHTFSLIIGADNWSVFDSWKDYNSILENYVVKIYPRLSSRITISSKLKGKVETLDSPVIDISSTFIREGIASDKNMKAFLPEGVYEYIVEKDLYK